MFKKGKIYIARRLRKDQTVAEKIMWNELRNKKFLNLKFRRQHLIKGYIVDFYCSEVKLVVEVDGLIHLKQVEEDKERQENIEKAGLKVIRFKNEEVENNLEEALIKLKTFIKK